MRWRTELESQNDCKSSSPASWYRMLWSCSIHSSQHITHMGNFSRLWSPLTKESPHEIMEGGRGILTGTGDEKGLLQLVLHKPHQTYQSKWEQQTKKERVLSWNSTLETQSESKAGHCLGNQGQCFSVHVLIFYGYNSSTGAAKKSLSYLLSFSVFFFFILS